MRDKGHKGAAIALAVLVFIVAAKWSTRVAAGSDAYGYVTQADLWLKGNLFIDQSFAAQAPWPMARWTFTPLGYRPEPDGYRIVPAYAPGLPMLMAAAKAIAGQCAVYLIVPLAAAVLVLATFAIGETVAGSAVALGAAVLVATSPTLLFMAMAPMSDVPAAAAWAVAVAFALRESTRAALPGGVAAALAILIRPNLAPLAALPIVWLVARRRFAPAIVCAALVSLGLVAIGLVNSRLYGSALRSGYDLTDAFALANVLPNLRRYGWWFVTAETPLAIGVLALAAWRRQWLLAAVVAAVWCAYLVYVPWDAWWYLRFLLPSWPMLAVGAASVVFAVFRRLAPAALAVLAVVGVGQAIVRDAFNEAAGESKYVEVARVVESLTKPGDVVISAQHSGTLRYYAGRLTVRWDVGDPEWFDRTVEWLAAHGNHPFVVVEEAELQALREKMGAASVIARLNWAPMVTFRGGNVKMFDALRRDTASGTVQQPESHAVDCAPAKTPPPLFE